MFRIKNKLTVNYDCTKLFKISAATQISDKSIGDDASGPGVPV